MRHIPRALDWIGGSVFDPPNACYVKREDLERLEEDLDEALRALQLVNQRIMFGYKYPLPSGPNIVDVLAKHGYTMCLRDETPTPRCVDCPHNSPDCSKCFTEVKA